MGDEKWIKLGVVGVDSGQLMLCDPIYIDSQWKKDDDFKNPKTNFSYGACGKITLNSQGGQLNFELGHAGVGVVFSSGLGDGIYEVFGKVKNLPDWGERLTEIKVVLIEDVRDENR